MSPPSLTAPYVGPEQIEVPGFVALALERLKAGGHLAYIVGGAIRDTLLSRPHQDWDIATSASPSQITQIFSDIPHYTLKHETVILLIESHSVEVTTFRGTEERDLHMDLSRRDFTINAMALDPEEKVIIDPFEGRNDLAKKLIRAVGDPAQRFTEDPIRLLRAVRLATELGFTVEPNTFSVIQKMASSLEDVAKERIRDELIKILLAPRPSRGFNLMRRAGLLSIIIPELAEGYLKRQNRYHRYTVYKHIMVTVDTARPVLPLRLAALLHDIAKPRVRTKGKDGWRFIGHEKVSAQMTREILSRLRFSSNIIENVAHLVEHHMIDYTERWTDAAVRRWIRRVGTDKVELLIELRKADLIAHGRGTHKADQLEELKERVNNALNEFVASTRELAIDGHTVMRQLGIGPGPQVGKILERLMALVTEHPELNTPDRLVDILKKM